MMVPSCAAGAVIGKGGETIGKLQRDTGAKMKMSKNQDTFPGEQSQPMECLDFHSVSSKYDKKCLVLLGADGINCN